MKLTSEDPYMKLTIYMYSVLDNMQWQLYEFEYNLSHLLLEYGFTVPSLIFIGVAYNVYGCFTNCVLGKVIA